MYYSLTIADSTSSINTYDDWYMAPTSRPSFSPPSFDMQTVTIPGRNGLLDVTTSLTKFPTFGNRNGSFEFLIHPESPMTWYETYSKVANYLHGQTKKVSLEDDSAYWYKGRFWLDNFRSNEHYSTITISYSVEPYKKSKWTTLEDWDVDPFDLADGNHISDWYKDLKSLFSDSWTQVFNSIDRFDDRYRQEMIGQNVFSPTIIVDSNDGNGLDIWFENAELEIQYITHFSDGKTVDNNIIFSMLNPNNALRIAVKGIGTISIEYNISSL